MRFNRQIIYITVLLMSLCFNPRIDATLLIDFIPTTEATCENTGQAAIFLARTSGLDGTHVAAYTALINGLVTDDVWCKLDVFYIYATQDSTTANLNLVSTSFNATVHGSPTFTADRGYQGTEGSNTVYIDTGFNGFTALSPHYTGDSAHLSSWQVTNGQGTASVGGSDGSNSYPIPRYFDNEFYVRLNQNATGVTFTNTDSRGHFIANRPGHALLDGYINGSLVVSPNITSIFGAPNLNFYSIGWNNGGTPEGYGQQVAMSSIGASLSPTQVVQFYNRLRTYMTAVGVP